MNNLGVIYDIKNDKAVILTRNSNFVMVRKREDMFLGQQVTFDDKEIYRPKKSIYRFVTVSASIAAVFVLMFIFSRFEPVGANVFGYIALDINPSMEFCIDKDYMVLKAVALNDEAVKIIDDVEVKNKTIESVIIEIIKQSKNSGYIKTGEKTDVLISATLIDKDKNKTTDYEAEKAKLDKLLAEIKKDIYGHDSSIVGRMLRVTSMEREAAQKYDVSMGKYYLFLKAKDQGIDISINELSNMKVSELIDGIDMQNEQELPVSTKDPLYTLSPDYTPLNTLMPEQTAEHGQPSKQTLTPNAEATPFSPKPAFTHANTASPTMIPSPVTTPVVQNSKGDATASLKIKHYSDNHNAITKAIRWDFVVENTGESLIDLKDVKVRYYFTDETSKTMNFMEYFYSLETEKGEVNGKVYRISGTKNANRYLEVTFDKGNLSPGETAWVFGALVREDWSDFNQEDDYSFNSEATTFSDWNRMTAYISDKLVWGIEP